MGALQLDICAVLVLRSSWCPRVRSLSSVLKLLSRIVIVVGDVEIVNRAYNRNILSLSKFLLNFSIFFLII